VKESVVELALVREANKHGVMCLKFVSPSCAGVPDRILLATGKVGFVELKRPGGKPTALQLRFASKLNALGIFYALADTPEKAKESLHNFLLT